MSGQKQIMRTRPASWKRQSYGVCQAEVDGFVAGSPCVAEFLGRYSKKTAHEYGRYLCTFFKWLRRRHGLDFSPEEFVDRQRLKRRSLKTADRRWGLRLALDFTRDNPDFEGCSDSYKYLIFSVLKRFFSYNEAELTTASRIYGNWKKRKYAVKPLTVARAKKVLGCLPQREKTILICMLQSGMAIGDVVKKFNYMRDYVLGCIKAGAERIKIDFPERKGNNFSYYTFISRDAIQELKKWFRIRAKWLEGGRDPGVIFITRRGKPLLIRNFNEVYTDRLRKAGLKNGPYSLRSHLFRKLFKTESRPPERGVDQACIEFMMGHITGLADMGGVYDKTPELYQGVVEDEYAKLEPFINIYSGKPASPFNLTKDEIEKLKTMAQLFQDGKLIRVGN